jgi:hypothetical protein
MSAPRTVTFTVQSPVAPLWSRAANGSQLSDFQVRNITSVTNGKPQLGGSTNGVTGNGAIPGEWNVPFQSWGADSVFIAWNGGRGDATNRRLIVTGGGHNDGANNGVFVYDFGSGDTPTGWRLAGTNASDPLGGYSATPASNTSSLSSLSTCFNGSTWNYSTTVYSDNRPTSIHTYGQLAYDPNLNRFYRFSGAAFTAGGDGCPSAYYLDMTTGLWNSSGTGTAFVAAVPGGNSGSLVTSSDGAKLLYMPASSTDGNFKFYSSAGALLGTSGATGITTGFGGSCTAVYSTRSATADKILLLYSTNGGGYTGPTVMHELTVNWNTHTVTKSASFATLYSNATYLGSADRSSGSMFHDALNSCYWLFGTIADTYGSASMNMGTQILKITDHTSASPYQITAHTMTGDSVAFTSNKPFGSNNRHVWFPNYRVVATVQGFRSPMSIIRIPGTQS